MDLLSNLLAQPLDVFQVLQLCGAVLVLLAFAMNVRGRWERDDRAYLWVNLAGGIMLMTSAGFAHQYGFFLLNAVWAYVALTSILKPSCSIER